MEVISGEKGVAIDAIPLSTKPPSIVDYNIIKEGKINIYQIIRADGSSKRRSSVELMMLVYKLLLLMFKVNAAGTKLQLLMDKD
ncbi:hypothetical protein Tco_1241838 [Tanacetum coccineum]